MSDLPAGWAQTNLGEIAAWGSGGTPSRSEPSYYGGGIPWIKTGELGPRFVSSTEESISEEGLSKSSAKLFPAGSVAIAMYGATIGKTSILGIPATTNQACAVGIPHIEATTKEFLYHFLCSQKEAFVEAGKGGAQPNISQAIIKDWNLPLAPLPEQKRIADKLDSVLARVDACRDRLDRLPALLKRFRQSILAAATSGRLTEDWRDERNILDTCWLPEAKITLKETVGLDLGYAFKSSEFEETGVRLLRGDNIEPGSLRWRDAKHFPAEKLNPFSNLILSEGDIVLAMDRPIISTGLKIARVRPADLPAVLVQRVCRFKVRSGLNSDYLYSSLQSKNFEDHLLQKQNGSSIPHISASQILSFEFSLPSLPEQTEIVRHVEILFAFADRLEARLATARRQVGQLTPALLAKAFRGELVPQDPADEPASELLKRLAAQREAAPKVKRGRAKA